MRTSSGNERTALVTGAGGFLGRHVSAALVAGGRRVVELGRAEAGAAPWSRAVWRSAIEAARPNLVLHLAGAREASDEASLHDINVGSARNLFAALDQLDTAPVVFLAGSAAEYGPPEDGDGRLEEDAVCRPQSEYGRSKLAQTLAALDWATRTKCKVVAARIFNPVGAGMPRSLAVGDFAAQLHALPAAGGVLQTGDLDVALDFLAAEDAARQIIALCEAPAARGPINVCSGRATSLRALTEALISASGKKVRIEVEAARVRANAPRVLYGAVERLRALGVTPGAVDVRAMVAAAYATGPSS